MREFAKDELAKFLRSVDKHARRPCTVIVIGGAAAALHYGAHGATLDIDTAKSVTELSAALKKARVETGLDVPVSQATVAESPWAYEGLKKLTVQVPEPHDWALMKIARLIEKDSEDIKEVHESRPFDAEVFLARYLTEMTHVQPAERLKAQFLTMMEELFGEKESSRLEATILRFERTGDLPPGVGPVAP